VSGPASTLSITRERIRTGPPRTPFLEQLHPDDRRDLLSMGRTIRLRPGAVALIEGQVSGRLLLLLKGHVRAISTSVEGKDILLAIRCPGDLVGEFSALDGLPHSATVSAMDEVEALSIAADAFREYLRTHSEPALKVLEQLTDRLRDADRKRAEFGSVDTTGRVAARLVELAEQHGSNEGGGVRIDLHLSQEELATWVGASREAVSRALRQFRDRGWIRTQRLAIRVLDLEALQLRAT
jgi:CRP-like cAMP-binding protein